MGYRSQLTLRSFHLHNTNMVVSKALSVGYGVRNNIKRLNMYESCERGGFFVWWVFVVGWETRGHCVDRRSQALRPGAYPRPNNRVLGRVLGTLKYPDTYSYSVELSTLVPGTYSSAPSDHTPTYLVPSRVCK
jgi:hypothetical protein